MASFLKMSNSNFHRFKTQFLTVHFTANFKTGVLQWTLEAQFRLFNTYQQQLTYARARSHNFVVLISKIHFLSNSQKRKDRKRSLALTYFHCQISLLLSQKYSIKLMFLAKQCQFYAFRMIWEKQPPMWWPTDFYTSLSNSSRAPKLRKLSLWDNFYNLLDLSPLLKMMVVTAAQYKLAKYQAFTPGPFSIW